jgi:hypothetical protein
MPVQMLTKWVVNVDLLFKQPHMWHMCSQFASPWPNAGANVNQIGGAYGNALIAAALSHENSEGSQLEPIQTLLDADAEVHQKLSNEYGNALQQPHVGEY